MHVHRMGTRKLVAAVGLRRGGDAARKKIMAQATTVAEKACSMLRTVAPLNVLFQVLNGSMEECMSALTVAAPIPNTQYLHSDRAPVTGRLGEGQGTILPLAATLQALTNVTCLLLKS